MEKYVVLPKKNLNDFIATLAQDGKVVAPVKKGIKNFVFAPVDSADDIELNYIPTIIPPKKYLMPQDETLVEYNKTEEKWDPVMEYEKITIFGVHTCDLAGIQCLNIALSEKPKDINYISRNKKVAIVGLECNDYCDEYATCALMDNHLPNGGYDLFFTDIGDSFMVHINTILGEELVKKTNAFSEAEQKHFVELERVRAGKRKTFKEEAKIKHHDLKPLFAKAMEDPIWEELKEKCVSCGNCTNVCPTCYCFDIQDEINLDLNTGKRIRKWDSCQVEPFAEVAGGENFREERGDRQRHRYMRKFNYPVEKFRRYFCTGCGRCSRTCMAEINMKDTINTLAGRKK